MSSGGLSYIPQVSSEYTVTIYNNNMYPIISISYVQ